MENNKTYIVSCVMWGLTSLWHGKCPSDDRCQGRRAGMCSSIEQNNVHVVLFREAKVKVQLGPDPCYERAFG